MHIDEIRFASEDERIQRYADEQGISEDQARQELLRVGAAMVDHGWAVSLDAADALSAEALQFLQAELVAASGNLFQATPEEYYSARLGLKELFTNREAVEALVRDIALVDPLAYRTHPEYFQEVMSAKGQGSADGIDNLVSTPVDAVVWAAGAVMCPSCAMEDLQVVWDAVKNLPEDLSYKGYLDTLHIMQGGGEDVIRRNAASSTELGASLGLGAAATGSAARALILERVGAKTTTKLLVPVDLPTNIHVGQQGKHIRGDNNFIEGRSYFNDGVDPAELLGGIHSGKYSVVGVGARGNPIVEFGRPIGIDGRTGQAVTRGQIHYGKNGAHIVPDARKQE